MLSSKHPLQEKIDGFLSGNPEIPREVLAQTTQQFAEKLEKFNATRGPRKGLPSLSQIGKPFCELHAEKIGMAKTPELPSFKIKMTYGDMTEVIAVAILKSAGVDIVALNQKTRLETSSGDLNGEFDLMINIDGELSMWDIKSASKFAFERKFSSYKYLKEGDSFGYVDQLWGYTLAERIKYPDLKIGGWIVISKETGEMLVCPADPDDEDEYRRKIKNTLNRFLEADDTNFKREFSDVPETFYKKETGNRKLGVTCSYCSFKFSCWENLEYRPKAKSKVRDAYEYYTFYQEEEDIRSVG